MDGNTEVAVRFFSVEIRIEKRLCTCCMEEHEVKTVLVQEHSTFKNIKVNYEASYLYCDAAEELYMDEADKEIIDIVIEKLGKMSTALFLRFQDSLDNF